MTRSPRFGRITRRLFAVFLMFALVPTAVLTVLALGYISDKAMEQVDQLQDEQAAMMADTLLGRLVVLTEQLKHFAAEESAGITPGSAESRTIGDNEFRVFPRIVLAGASGVRSRDEAGQRLDRGEQVLARFGWDGAPSQTWLLKSVQPGSPESALAGVLLTETTAIGDSDSRDLRNIQCIYDERAQPLFATDARICDAFAGVDAYKDVSRGTTEANADGVAYHAGYRSVFLGSLYGAHNWRVVVARPAEEIFADAHAFRRQFFSLALLLVLSLSFASLFLIRRQMTPLTAIMAGIERMTQKQYDDPVEVRSGDEFEDMADAFNTMSAKVSHQLLTQTSMSEIDQLILSRIKKEDIIKIVLEKTSLVMPADYIAMLLFERGEGLGEMFRLSESFGGELLRSEVRATSAELEELAVSGHLLLKGSSAELPDYIVASNIPQQCSFELLPIVLEGACIALILLAHRTPPALEPEHMVLAKNYADRIAVALANAEWEERLFHQAHYDSLTGLPNRLAFMDRLEQSVSRSSRQGGTLGILFVDLDNFKLVNDSLGHPVGDKYIQVIAERFEECLRAEDTVSRLGGDEFVITAIGSESHDLTVASISRVADRILEAAAEPVKIDGHELRGSASVGIAIYPKDGEDPEALIRNADTAMYHAKSLGRGIFQFYSSELNEELLELMRLSTDIRSALENDQFELHFQPKVDTFSHEITGAEALLRWNHPERGMIRPDVFITAAEGLGLITAIGDWTLHAACRQIRAWRDAAMTPPRIAINVSAAQLRQSDIFRQVRSNMKRYGLSGRDLELEITENLLVQDMDTAVTVLEELRSLGVKISIDDYGTGYSSLAYMKELPVDMLKIDRAFIRNLENDAADRAIVNSTIVLARHLGMKVLAEGVETEGQLQALQAFGCDEVQGYYFSEALPQEEFRRLLLEDRALEGCSTTVAD